MERKLSSETICVQAGWKPKKGEPRVLPIYQSTTFKYDTSEEMGKLFRDCQDPIEIIKWKEILANLEDMLDLSEDIADALKRVVLKYA